jgi:hypothetical protein
MPYRINVMHNLILAAPCRFDLRQKLQIFSAPAKIYFCGEDFGGPGGIRVCTEEENTAFLEDLDKIVTSKIDINL